MPILEPDLDCMDSIDSDNFWIKNFVYVNLHVIPCMKSKIRVLKHVYICYLSIMLLIM